MTMSKRSFAAVCFLVSFLAGCSVGDRGLDGDVVAQVNGYRMTVEDLKNELKNIAYDETSLLRTREGRTGYLNRLLEKQILLQEAQRRGLDKEKDFMRSIENYWEQALLKALLGRKSREISELIYISDEEIERYYADSGETMPLSAVREDIKRAIRQEKETSAMNAWIEELRKKAYIRINEDILEEAFSN